MEIRRFVIKSCQGPSCRAWGAKKVLKTLKCHFKMQADDRYQTCSTPCMNQCGGGAAIRVGTRNKLYKIREASETLPVLSKTIK